MDDTDVTDDATAYQALAHALAAVGGINQRLGAGGTQGSAMSFLNPVDDVLQRMEDWTGRLVSKLTAIATQLGASFSITVGTAVTITISCGPFGRA